MRNGPKEEQPTGGAYCYGILVQLFSHITILLNSIKLRDPDILPLTSLKNKPIYELENKPKTSSIKKIYKSDLRKTNCNI